MTGGAAIPRFVQIDGSPPPAEQSCWEWLSRSIAFWGTSLVFSYNTWMLILAAVAALTLPFTAISSVIDLLGYRSRLSRPSAAPDMVTTARLRWRSFILGLLASFSLFGLVFSTYALISVPGPSGPQGAQGPPEYQTRMSRRPIGIGSNSISLGICLPNGIA